MTDFFGDAIQQPKIGKSFFAMFLFFVMHPFFRGCLLAAAADQLVAPFSDSNVHPPPPGSFRDASVRRPCGIGVLVWCLHVGPMV